MFKILKDKVDLTKSQEKCAYMIIIRSTAQHMDRSVLGMTH